MLTQALLVDDSRSVLNFLKRHIEAEGLVEATTFLDPVQALACARERVFDLVLVDYEMPHMDGISFIRTLRTLPGCVDIPIAMITSRQTDDVKMEALQAGATDFLPKQPQSVEMTVRLRNLIQLGAAVRKLNDRAAHLASEVAAAIRKLGEREEEIILRLALAVEYRDNDTGEHTLRVARYSRIIAEQLGLPARLCRDIYLAAPLHDVGKVAIPDNILLKPGRLTDEEMAVIRTHATIGERILADSSCELIQLGAQIAAGHHERWDGAGYPNGLKTDEIPVAARVVAVADVFDALTTRRPYKEPMPLGAARNYLVENQGRQFDPACVEAFLSRWNEVMEIAAGQQATPFQKTEATLAPVMERAVEGRPAEDRSPQAVPAA
ncbi:MULTISPECIES: HD domain-containing phosphohydrolase [Bradyrhizobium]|uniref:Two-component response regulator n=1 Tax=Bradyrhizobium diazoefficiens (strain JCM 10833 / BCRC 13528 / IAM 13628 / NBRC 14792 / USDA 110) TaxID=224911 RepID=Q89SR0_BRADU|nr:HD domain-containing phosphohydrolase [Bradyrhizobium diazoefficiens]MBP1058826.1 putative two-component system response regulator [Bradyrhizobium japonicum]AND87851.1 transcriptional regulator [Bradyrhizobium diazoefficiens USDA 110]AWO89371.1 response regulator [Bradyrhizobium diazoefficiens]PDT57908.1 two-component system response regulator [Bradyrhizobium diazoefficiens]QBP21167.1 two-component system response regulator [Bradyrhizobium diazoefficiens]